MMPVYRCCVLGYQSRAGCSVGPQVPLPEGELQAGPEELRWAQCCCASWSEQGSGQPWVIPPPYLSRG